MDTNDPPPRTTARQAANLKQINFAACRAVVGGGGSIRVHSRLEKSSRQNKILIYRSAKDTKTNL